jgi:hypothetical protein
VGSRQIAKQVFRIELKRPRSQLAQAFFTEASANIVNATRLKLLL